MKSAAWRSLRSEVAKRFRGACPGLSRAQSLRRAGVVLATIERAKPICEIIESDESYEAALELQKTRKAIA